MESTLRKLKSNSYGGIATYALILFGMIFIMYLFGFESLWSSYIGAGRDVSQTDTQVFGKNIFDALANALTDNTFLAGTLGVLGIGAILIARFVGGSQTVATILQYGIPLMLLIVLNIFIFPMTGLGDDVAYLNAAGVSFTIFLFAFFNLFYLLAVLEFMRGNV